MKITNYLLKNENVQKVDSPNHSGELKPEGIIIHYTAGRDADSSVKTLCDPAKKASAHLVVGRDGKIFQLVPFNKIAWHAGRSSYVFPDGTERIGFNRYSVGIEIDNAGLLSKAGDQYVAWFGRAYSEEEVFYGIHRNETVAKYWHRYSEIQIQLVEEICNLLAAAYDIKYILGHEEISPRRKIDPGPAFPLDKMRMRVLHAQRDQDEPEVDVYPIPGVVTASSLNIRENPTVVAKAVARPLPRDKKVQVVAKADGWYRVKTEIEGWVAGDYLDLQK